MSKLVVHSSISAYFVVCNGSGVCAEDGQWPSSEVIHWHSNSRPRCNIVFISDKINTRVVSNIIEQEVSTPETVKDTFG